MTDFNLQDQHKTLSKLREVMNVYGVSEKEFKQAQTAFKFILGRIRMYQKLDQEHGKEAFKYAYLFNPHRAGRTVLLKLLKQ